MRVLINAISIGGGGGLAVLAGILKAMVNIETDVHWYVTAEPSILSKLPKSDKIIGLPYSWVKKSPLHHLYWYEAILPKLIRQLNINVCFSQTNFLPRSKISCPSLLLIQQAGYFSEEFRQLTFHWHPSRFNRILWNQKEKWAHRSIKSATQITVQTESLAKQISQQLRISKDKISIIPHGPGIIKTIKYSPKSLADDPNATLRIGYITKWGVQKDFDTTLYAIKLLKERGVKAMLILTLDEAETHSFSQLNHLKTLIEQYGIVDCVENLNDIHDVNTLGDLYDSLDIFIFPSLYESFGFPLVEAMASRLPVIVSDTESNLEIAGRAGIKFPAKNAEQLAITICQLIQDKELYKQASQNSIDRANEFSWSMTANKILHTIQKMAKETQNA